MDELEKLTLESGNLLSLPGKGKGEGKRTYTARFIRAGRVRTASNKLANIEVTQDALLSAHQKGLFNKCAVFVDHAGFWDNPSLDNLAGVTKYSSVNLTEASIEGLISLNSTPAGILAANIIDELLQDPATAPDVGLSLSFYPIWEMQGSPVPGDNIRRIVDIQHIESIDLVFQPAADGRILAALSTYAIKNLEKGLNQMEPEQEQTQPVDPGEQWLNQLAKTVTRQVLHFSGLPQQSQDRLAEGLYETPGALDEAIGKERSYLASLVESQVINIGNTPPRGGQITGMRTGFDRLQLAFDALFNGKTPGNGIQPLTGIRELYLHLSGDYELTGMFQPENVQFANVTSSTMAEMVANVMNKRVQAEFQQYSHWWNPVVIEEDFASLQAIKWITVGGVGDLPTVAEGAAYTELNWDDKSEAASFVKKGGYLGLTLEAIDKDDTGKIRAAPRALAQSAWLTLSKAVSYIFTQASGAGPTLADTYALFESGHHNNLGTSALSIATWNAARLAMRKVTEFYSGERLGALVVPKFLLVPPDLEMTAIQVLASDYDYTYALANAQAAPVNPNADGNIFNDRLNQARARVIVVDLWTDTNDWAAVCDPRLYPTIGIGYRYGRSPEIFSVASPTAGLMFSNDTMPIKVRFFFAVGPIDYRGMYKANV